MCWCCGKHIDKYEAAKVHDTWEGRMDGYCETCAGNRCDAFPGDCPNDLNPTPVVAYV